MSGMASRSTSAGQGPAAASRSGGFTLIELLVALTVLAILAAIAIPGYNEQVRKTRRAAAAAELLEVAQGLERYNTVNGRYDNRDAAGTNVDICNRETEGGFYTVRCFTVTTTTFELRAVPANAQLADRCGTFTYTQAGQRGLVGQEDGLTPADCW